MARLDNSVSEKLPVEMLPLSAIRVNTQKNLRKQSYTAKEIADLAQSIRDKGAIQLLTVVASPGDDGCTHELWAGFQRYKAMLLNAEEYGASPAALCRIMPVAGEPVEGEPDMETRQLLTNLAENVKRKSLTLMDSSYAAVTLKDKGLSQKSIAGEFGKSESWLSRVIRFNELRPAIQKKIADGEITFKTASALLDEDEAGQDALIERIEAAGPGGAKNVIAEARKKKKGKKRGGTSAQDRAADKRGLSAKAAIHTFQEAVGKIAEQEKKTKADERLIDVYSFLVKLMTGAIGAKAFNNKLAAVLS